MRWCGFSFDFRPPECKKTKEKHNCQRKWMERTAIDSARMSPVNERKWERASTISMILILNSLLRNYCNGFEWYVPFKQRFIWSARKLHNMIWIYEPWAREWIVWCIFRRAHLLLLLLFFFACSLAYVCVFFSSSFICQCNGSFKFWTWNIRI